MRFCPSCKRLLSQEANSCIYCGESHLRELPSLYQLKPSPQSEIILGGKAYDVDGIIGRGGYGFVIKISDPATGQPYALKMPLSASYLFDPSPFYKEKEFKVSEDMILRERKLLSSLNHPGIVGVISQGETSYTHKGKTNSIPYYIMELAQGDVETLLRELMISLEERIKIIREVSSALAYLHRLNLVYRDLKLMNILIMDRKDQGIHYVLSDFGTTKARVETGRSGIVGTPRYLDPAYVRYPDIYRRDPRIDVYSLGVVATELFLGTDDWRKAMNIDPDTYTINIDFASEIVTPLVQEGRIPKEVGEVIYRATLKEPDERFSNAEEFLVAFQEAVRAIGKKITSTKPVKIPQQKRETSILYIPFRVRITVPQDLQAQERTFAAPKVEYRGGKLVMNDPRGVQIVLPQGQIPQKAEMAEGPSFFTLLPSSNSIYLRLNRKKLNEIFSPLLEIDQNLEGEAEFEGKIKVEA